MSESRFDFFRSGVIIADLRDEQNSPVDKDRFARKVSMGRSVSIHCFSIHVGRGSDEQVALGEDSNTFSTSSSDTG